LITAVDTNVLVDVFIEDSTHYAASANALRRSIADGTLVACDVVWAETAAAFDSDDDARSRLATLGVRFLPTDARSASGAGAIWRAYKRAGGRRTRLLPDFLVGAHATHQADRLLTRDQGFYRKYFRDLRVLDPAA
jgi:predicted nucleic acid-binding protein